MRRRYSSIIFLVALALLAVPQSAWTVGASPTTQADSARTCGATVEDKLAAARKALGTNSANPYTAVVCLTDALAALNEQLRNIGQERSLSGELRAPFIDYPPQPAGR